MIAGRRIAIGDVHGCADELKELLSRLNPTPEDDITFLGDLINRGPNSAAVMKIVRRLGARALLGNHERRLLNCHDHPASTRPKPQEADTIRQLTAEDWEFIRAMPLWHEYPEDKIVLVHGGFLPQPLWRYQPASIVTEIQVINPHGRPARRNKCPDQPRWAESWKGPPFVIYGHTPGPEIHRTPWTLGIDTACVQGGKLTACLLPNLEIVQVPSNQ